MRQLGLSSGADQVLNRESCGGPRTCRFGTCAFVFDRALRNARTTVPTATSKYPATMPIAVILVSCCPRGNKASLMPDKPKGSFGSD